MNSLVGEKRLAHKPIALCWECRRDTLPARRSSSWHRDVHRSAARGMVTAPDPVAARKRRQKDRKAEKRAAKHLVRVLSSAIASAVPAVPSATMIRRLITTAGFRAVERSEDCERCAAQQRPAA